jgi:hypothetical protein
MVAKTCVEFARLDEDCTKRVPLAIPIGDSITVSCAYAYGFRTSSGSLAIFAAIRRALSLMVALSIPAKEEPIAHDPC